MSDRLIDEIISATLEERLQIYTTLSPAEKVHIDLVLASEMENPWALYADDPVGFVEKGIKEVLWTKQREILESLRVNKRTAVPACHAPGKSHLAALAVAWWISVHPPGTAIAITTANTHRQVRNIMWANIRRVHIRHNLAGEILTTQWKLNNTVVSYGFSPAGHDETSVQGIHAPHLLIVVDEAGGLSETIGGALEALMTGGHTRLLVLGNPPTDVEQTWFERICSSPNYNIIPIPTKDTPNFTGEKTGLCRSCPPFVEPHEIATHLVDQTWVDDVISEFGDDAPFVIARVHAKFPRSGVGKVIPYDWAEGAKNNEEPLESESIALGIDIAADGGDEFVIAQMDGWVGSILHRSSGKVNANAVDVAGMCLRYILTAEAKHKERGITDKIRVKIDVIGVGWGVSSLLETWGKEGRHHSTIVGVNVAMSPRDTKKFKNQRAEMWWNARTLMQTKDGKIDVRLEVDNQVLAQLAGPTFKSDSSGRIQIESKLQMKARGIHSPDRAEALLLAMYESRPVIPAISPVLIGQENPWKV